MPLAQIQKLRDHGYRLAIRSPAKRVANRFQTAESTRSAASAGLVGDEWPQVNPKKHWLRGVAAARLKRRFNVRIWKSILR